VKVEFMAPDGVKQSMQKNIEYTVLEEIKKPESR
jgi:hypothetical protein